MKLKGKIAQEGLESGADITPRPHKAPRVWIAVADGELARIFKKNGQGLELIGEITPDRHKKIATNASVGRTFSSGSVNMHHKYEPHMNKSRKHLLSFTHELAAFLDKAVQEDAFDRLVLAAAPQTLGSLRQDLSKHVHDRIVAELDKDLTKMNALELQSELDKTTWF